MSEKPSIQVIGVGFPRTGTSSLQEALRILDFKPCHHFASDVLDDSFPYRKGRRWQQVYDITDKARRQAAMRDIFEAGEYRATCDFPPSSFADDLVEMYPDAKFVLSVRKTPEAWRASFNNTIGLCRTPWHVAATYLMPMQRMLLQPLCKQWDALNTARYRTRTYCTDSTEVYLRHNEWVRKVIPKDRLLEHEASEGWEPLCGFLGVKTPDVPYPHLNEGEDLRRWFLFLAGLGVFFWICAIALTSWACQYVWRRAR